MYFESWCDMLYYPAVAMRHHAMNNNAIGKRRTLRCNIYDTTQHTSLVLRMYAKYTDHIRSYMSYTMTRRSNTTCNAKPCHAMQWNEAHTWHTVMLPHDITSLSMRVCEHTIRTHCAPRSTIQCSRPQRRCRLINIFQHFNINILTSTQP